jgi:predicted Holliday junction resolvase-like endonuclease
MSEPFAIFITAGAFLIIGLIIGGVFVWKEDDRWFKRSKKTQRAILGGKFSEHLAPYLPHFPSDLRASEGRFIGDPIDFVFFSGKDEQAIKEIVFLEVKSGRAQLSPIEQQIRKAIEEKRVRWHEYRVPEEITHTSDGV